MVIAQLAYWVRTKDGRQRHALQAWLTRLVDAMRGRIHGFNPHLLALTPGTRLGVYEVTAPIGAGVRRGIKTLPANVRGEGRESITNSRLCRPTDCPGAF